MTTSTWTANPYHTTNATFRTWGSSIGTALAAIGMTKTSDTGQINWTTVTFPSTTSSFKGYEIWRFNDTPQTTYPLFFRIDYGSSSAVSTDGALKITIGTGSSGAGVITGNYLTDFVIGYSSTHTGGASYATSHGSGMALYLAVGQCTIGFAIERSLNSSGVATGEGFTFVGSGNSSSVGGGYWQVYNYADPATYVSGWSPVILPYSYGSGGGTMSSSTSLSKDGSTAPIIPIPLTCPGVTPWVSKLLMATAPGDAGVYTATMYGSSLTYRGFSAYNNEICPISTIPGSSSGFLVPAAIYWQ